MKKNSDPTHKIYLMARDWTRKRVTNPIWNSATFDKKMKSVKYCYENNHLSLYDSTVKKVEVLLWNKVFRQTWSEIFRDSRRIRIDMQSKITKLWNQI